MLEFSKGWRPGDTPSAIRELIPFLSTCNVALGFDSPEDGSDIFVAPVAALLERKISLGVEYTESLDDLDDRSFQVHGVEVKELESVSDEVLALLDSVLDAILPDLLIVSLDGLEGIFDLLGDEGLAEFDTPNEIRE